MKLRRVVVTGMGCIGPIGNSVEAHWQSLLAGRSGAASITRFDAAKFRTTFAAEVKGFDPLNYFDRAEARKLDLFTQFALVAAQEASTQANLNPDTLDLDRCGIVFGSGSGGVTTFEQEVSAYAKGDGTPRYSPMVVPKSIINTNVGQLSIKYGFRGLALAVVNACATSNIAIIEAFQKIQWNKADVIISGGSETPINPLITGGFCAARALSAQNACPTTASRPFDVGRSGFVIAEGGAVVVLEELGHALRRNAPILCEVLGGATASDAHHLTAPHPEALGMINAMRWALADANLTPQDVDYVNAHATSTDLGDLAELRAIESVFGEHRPLISANKSMTGHLIGAAGALEAISCIKSIQKGVIPATINFETLDPAAWPNHRIVTGQPLHKHVDVAVNNSFGFGGHNSSLVLGRYLGL